jgi:ParB/RepB/Spo0J family partition protein
MSKKPEPKLLDTAPTPEVDTVPVELIRPTDPAATSATRASIDSIGFASAVVLRRLSDRDRTRGGMNFDVDPHEYEVVDGEGRVSDARDAGILEVPAIIYPEDTPPVVLDFVRTVRNNARRNNPVAEARSYRSMVQNHGMPPETIARTQGVPVATIRKRLRLASLDDEFLQAVESKKIAVGTAERIANLSASAKEDVREILRSEGRVRRKDVSEVLDAERSDALQATTGLFPDAPESAPESVEAPEKADPTYALREAIRRHLERGESKRSIERITDQIYSEVHG